LNITLVTSPLFNHSTFYSDINPKAQPYMPLGLLALAAYLKSYNITVNIADLNIAFNNGQWKNDVNFYQHAAKYLESFNSKLIGFQTANDAYHHTINIAKQLKIRNPDTFIILGGCQATVTDIDTINSFPFIDAIVRGEGELALLNLVNAFRLGKNLHKTKGITYRNAGKAVKNVSEELIANLDDLPTPLYNLYPISKNDFVCLEIGRGCPFECTFCSTAPFWKRKTRYKSVQRVINEIKYLIANYKTHNFSLVHDLFTANKSWVYEFCKKIIENKLEIKWTCCSRTDTVTNDLLKIMSEAGCVEIFYGIETASTKIQKIINKNLNLENTQQIIKKTFEYAITPVTAFITGFPFDTFDTLQATLEEFFQYKRQKVPLAYLFLATPERGSSLYKENCKNLEFCEHFLDFPLPQKILESNLELIKANPEIFCGFFLFKNNNIESKILYGIDGFSPLVNTLGFPVSLAATQMENSLEFYLLWIKWLEGKNNRQNNHRNEIFYGTIQDMLDFLRYLYSINKTSINYFLDILKYEEIKNKFRSLLYVLNTQSPATKEFKIFDYKDIRDKKPIQSSLNQIATFNYDIKEIYSKGLEKISNFDTRTTYILFYIPLRSIEKSPAPFQENLGDIFAVKIDVLTKILLEICDGNAEIDDIVQHIMKSALNIIGGSEVEFINMVLERFKRLYELGIVNFEIP